MPAKLVFDLDVLAGFTLRIAGLTPNHRTLLIGIDGPGGSGKSTLARELAALLTATVVAFDDFYRPAEERRQRFAASDEEIGGDFDWRRLRDQVLEPLATDEAARYQRYDWDRDELAEWHTISSGGVVIVEGCYSTRDELRGSYDLTVWVDAPRAVRLARGVERDGEGARGRWLDEWMPEEDRYVAVCRPAERADVVIAGGGGGSSLDT